MLVGTSDPAQMEALVRDKGADCDILRVTKHKRGMLLIGLIGMGRLVGLAGAGVTALTLRVWHALLYVVIKSSSAVAKGSHNAMAGSDASCTAMGGDASGKEPNGLCCALSFAHPGITLMLVLEPTAPYVWMYNCEAGAAGHQHLHMTLPAAICD
ncbi:hypothetical protein HaLaN_20796 [Haematococcus lacustris]|uniref:Uncharacterized protein n=1 Tax=Haematococcus lacustris TaxID=44745 RepID=A0A699ZKM8_HAELA|nr:hypothetical protein HaLaN_20796 [Haematococcus lacustris]